MPSTVIEVCIERSPQEEAALIDAVHAALVEAFQIPQNDGEIRLLVHAAHRMRCPGRTQPQLMTIVSIDAFAGRSLDAKRKLYRSIADKLGRLGIPSDHVMTVLRDVPRENWGLRGGRAGCDVELGFKVEV